MKNSFNSTDEIIGQSYETASGKKFKVVDAEPYPVSKISNRYKEVLDFMGGNLVAIGYRGVLIPNITLKNGVARLLRIEIGSESFDRPGAISKALGIKDAMTPYKIK